MVSRYFYLELEIYLSTGGAEVSVQAALQRAVQVLFGECGAGGVRADVLRVHDAAPARVLLRVRAAQLRKLRAALALSDPPLRVLAEAPSLQALFAMSAPESGARSWRLGDAGQHVLLVASKEQLSSPSTVTLPPPEPAPGLILPDGSINWGCPCLGGMATGPCGTQFRDAFSCFHYSEADPKGSDCYEKFSVMQECMAQYPQLYAKDDDDDELAAALADAEQGAGDPASDGGRAGDSSASASADQ